MKLELDAVERALQSKLRQLLKDSTTGSETLAQLGLWGFTLPVDVGGLDLGASVAAVASEEFGRALAPTSVTDTLLAAEVVAAAGLEANAGWLERVTAGRVRAVLVGLRDGQFQLRNDRLHGHSELVPAPPTPADDVLMVAQTSHGPTVFRVAHDGTEVRFELGRGRGVGQYVLDDVGSALRIGQWGAGRTVLSRALPRTRVLHAAYLIGTTEHMLELTVEHVRQRKLFDKRLVDFQSVLLRLAEIRARIEAVRMLVYHAGWRCDNPGSAEPFAAEALAGAAELAFHASRTMMQLHGAAGMLAGSATATAYETIAREAVRFGAPSTLWTEAGQGRLRISEDSLRLGQQSVDHVG